MLGKGEAGHGVEERSDGIEQSDLRSEGIAMAGEVTRWSSPVPI